MAEQAGLRPLLPWVKRSMLQSHAFFQRYSVPGSCNDWTRKTHEQYQPRGGRACAVCAAKDWIENRYNVFLFATPDGDTSRKAIFYSLAKQASDDLEDTEAKHYTYLTKGGTPYAGPKEEIDKVLTVYKYIEAFPKIPGATKGRCRMATAEGPQKISQKDLQDSV